MIHASPTLSIIVLIIMVCILAVFLYTSFKIIKAMYSLPNEKLIQINIDRRLFPLLGNILMVYLFSCAALYSASQVEKALFSNDKTSKFVGYIGSSFIADFVKFRGEDGISCDHIQINGKDVIVYLSGTELESLCGISHQQLEDQHTYPLKERDGKSIVLVGNWPFSYELEYNGLMRTEIKEDK